MRLPPILSVSETFSEIFECLQRAPFNSFGYFATEWMLKNHKRSPLEFSALCDLPEMMF